MKKIIFLVLILGAMMSCNKDEFADINQDPSNVNEPDMSFLLTESLFHLDHYTYTEWFYDNSKYIFPWTQTTVSTGGNSSDLVLDKEHGARAWKWYTNIMPPLSEIREFVDNRFEGKDRVAYQKLKQLTYPIQIMQGIKVTDFYGSQAYTEAMQARYTNPPLLTPVYDDQETLFTTWLEELNQVVEVLTTEQEFNGESVNSVSPGAQDFVYNGDWNKWAKFANSLKLRIAARLLHQDKAKALKIVEEAFAHPAGLLTETADDFYWSPGSNYYHFNKSNTVSFGAGSRNLIDFLRNNKDPRVRFLFNKNSYNSKVIQGFFDEGKPIPSYIAQYVDSHMENVDGVDKEIFDGWKAPGEPWVRYFGAPAAPDAKLDPALKADYFEGENYKLGSRYFNPWSRYSEKNLRTDKDLLYPDVPGVTVEYKDDAAYHSLLFSAAEVNLYLAEFKLLGANLPGDANTYFRKAIAQSVESHDKLARDNDLLYYKEAYDKVYGKAINLETGEVDALLANAAYSLTGDVTVDLEKVYIQQYINFLSRPNELFVTVRRSGYPKTASTILAREPFLDGGIELVVPRRFTASMPTEDNINFENIMNSLQLQGFTPGNSEPQVLHDQRLWYDQTAPDWGEGSNY